MQYKINCNIIKKIRKERVINLKKAVNYVNTLDWKSKHMGLENQNIPEKQG